MLSVDFKKYAGFITISGDAGKLTRWITGDRIWTGWSLHFFVKKEFSKWGFSKDWCDGPLYYFGLGRILLLCYF